MRRVDVTGKAVNSRSDSEFLLIRLSFSDMMIPGIKGMVSAGMAEAGTAEREFRLQEKRDRNE